MVIALAAMAFESKVFAVWYSLVNPVIRKSFTVAMYLACGAVPVVVVILANKEELSKSNC